MPDHDSAHAGVRDHQTGAMRDAWTATLAALDLTDLGWARAARTAPVELLHEHPTASPARVVRADRGRRLLVAGGGEPCQVHDRSHPRDLAVVGDWVLVEGDVAIACLPRWGTLARRRGGDSASPQLLAANVDLVLVAEALDPGRHVNVARVARFVALARGGGADVHVLLTGADRLDGDAGDLPAHVAGAPALATSTVDGRGIADVRDLLPRGTTAVVVGASGAGKSSIANALMDEPLLATGGRRGSGTGRHVTSTSRLVPIPGCGLLVDSPGIRQVGMHADLDVEAFASSAVDALADGCRFGDCGHDTEPGCAVREAIDAGTIAEAELGTWRKLEREALRERARADARLRRELHDERMSRARAHVKARRRGEIVERRR